MAKAKQGDVLSCSECGLVVMVDEACGCATAEIVCCDQPMAKGKLAADRAKKKATAKAASPRGSAKTGKTSGAAKTKAVSAKPKVPPKKAPVKKATKATKK